MTSKNRSGAFNNEYLICWKCNISTFNKATHRNFHSMFFKHWLKMSQKAWNMLICRRKFKSFKGELQQKKSKNLRTEKVKSKTLSPNLPARSGVLIDWFFKHGLQMFQKTQSVHIYHRKLKIFKGVPDSYRSSRENSDFLHMAYWAYLLHKTVLK